MTCSGGVCSPTAPDAVLNVDDLANMLASGNMKVRTGSGAVNIDVVAALSWNSTSRLTLDANTNVSIHAPVTVAGSGALTLTYNDGGSGGDLIFSNGGNATFANLSSSLIINGNGYALVGNVATLASAIKANPSGHFALGNSYDATNLRPHTTPIKTPFTGTFEGLGQTISNLTLMNEVPCTESQGITCMGFFAEIRAAGLVRDLRLADFNYSPAAFVWEIGGLAAISDGTVANVYGNGSIQGVALNMGGLVG